MNVVLHENAEAYEREYQRIRGAFIAHGSTLNAWLSVKGINRQLAYRALKGRSFGKRAIELRREALAEVARLVGQPG